MQELAYPSHPLQVDYLLSSFLPSVTKRIEHPVRRIMGDYLPWVYSSPSHPVPSVSGWVLVCWTLRHVLSKVSDANLQSVTLRTLDSMRIVWVGKL